MDTRLRRARELYADEGGLELAGRAMATVSRRAAAPVYRRAIRALLARTPVIDSDDLREGRAPNRVWEFGEAERVLIDHPRREELPERMRANLGEYVISRPFVAEMDDARVWTPGGVVRTNEGVVLESAESSPEILEDWLVERCHRRGAVETTRLIRNTAEPALRLDTAFPMHRHPSTNYYHWILGHLAKIRALEEYERRTGTSPTIVVSESSPRWVLESMELVGFDPEEWVSTDEGPIAADVVVVPSHNLRYTKYEPSVEECRFLRERMTGRLDRFDTEVESSDRIYLSREDATTRRVRNEDALLDSLESLGFRKYTLSELSVPEQVELLSEAEEVVAPHGAALTNITFSTDLRVVELVPRADMRGVYLRLARELGFDYEWVVCESDGRDMVADVEAVAAAATGDATDQRRE